jgi:hypothetical protein
MLRASLEGNYSLDAHIRDPNRNDFFKSPYFTASLKGKNNNNNQAANNNNNNNIGNSIIGLNLTAALNNSSVFNNNNNQQQQQQQPSPVKQTSAKPASIVNRPTPQGFYKGGTFTMSTF